MPNVTPPKPGDLIACHTTGIQGVLIRLGERLRFRSGDFWSHFAICDDQPNENKADPWVIQAEAHGVTGWGADGKSYYARHLSEVCIGGVYEVVELPPHVDPQQIVSFARSQVGKKYGWISIVSIGLRILLPKWLPLPSVRSNSTWICSALAGESSRFGGWLHDWGNIYQVVPSELFAAIKGIGVRDVVMNAQRIALYETEAHDGRTDTQDTQEQWY